MAYQVENGAWVGSSTQQRDDDGRGWFEQSGKAKIAKVQWLGTDVFNELCHPGFCFHVIATEKRYQRAPIELERLQHPNSGLAHVEGFDDRGTGNGSSNRLTQRPAVTGFVERGLLLIGVVDVEEGFSGKGFGAAGFFYAVEHVLVPGCKNTPHTEGDCVGSAAVTSVLKTFSNRARSVRISPAEKDSVLSSPFTCKSPSHTAITNKAYFHCDLEFHLEDETTG